MGNTSNAIILVLIFDVVCALMALSIWSVNPCSPHLYTSAFTGASNTLTNSMNGGTITDTSTCELKTHSYDYNYSSTGIDSMKGTSILDATSIKMPDWIGAGWSWVSTYGRLFIDMIGAPYTFLSLMGIDPNLSAIVGTFMGLIFLFIFVNWILGRDT